MGMFGSLGLVSNETLQTRLSPDPDLENMLTHAKEVLLRHQHPILLLYDADFDGMGSAAIFSAIADHFNIPLRKMAMTYESVGKATNLMNNGEKNIVCVDFEPHEEIHEWLAKPKIDQVFIFGHHPTRKDLLELDANRSEVHYFNPLTETGRRDKISNGYVLAHLASTMGVKIDNVLFSAVFCATGYGFSEDAKLLRQQSSEIVKIKRDLIDKIRLLYTYRTHQCDKIVNALKNSTTCYNPNSPIVRLGAKADRWETDRIRRQELAWSLKNKGTKNNINVYQIRRFDVPNAIFNKIWPVDRKAGKKYSVFYSVKHHPKETGGFETVTKISLRGKVNVSRIVEKVATKRGITNWGGHDFSAGMVVNGHYAPILEDLCHG
jgi:hypothetical protein